MFLSLCVFHFVTSSPMWNSRGKKKDIWKGKERKTDVCYLIRFLRELIDTYMLTPATVPTLLVAIRTTLFSSTNIRPNAALSGTNIPFQTTTPPPQQQQPPLGTSDVAMLTAALANPQATRRPPPAAEEVCAIKRQCAADILSLFPAPAIAQAFFCGTIPRATNHTNHHPTNHSISNNNDDNDDNDDDNDNTALLQAIEMDLLDPFSDAYCNKHLIFSVIETVLVKLLPELAEKGVMDLMEERGVAVS
ncbi:hypothetical protein BGW36DRAFT_29187 [Talaromyces proteolyticus]|uniref:PXA domain-containing protein n=1 Tax=Talaromyces proteolyticus TaxID=1131652 RepID=A0AAD4PWV7_9EURO|nr:uncharacterized protein BGW36DRAFT_29187 [Talaromyces proteolyticus]KAH8692852.1 hypothetical protein BGW36DRAFT_29187 [Talaromyces proteolyticus]